MMARRKLVLFWTFLQVSSAFAALGSTASKIQPSKVVIFVDMSSNVPEAAKKQMDILSTQIIAELPEDCYLNIVGISESSTIFYKGYVKDMPQRLLKNVPTNTGGSIDAEVFDTLLYGIFPYSMYQHTAEVLIMLVGGGTKLTGKMPEIASLKKTIVVQFGDKEQEVWKNMSSRADMGFRILSPDMMQTVVQKIKVQLINASRYVCDTNKFAYEGASRENLFIKTQCFDCNNQCNFESSDIISDSCRDECSYHPLFKTPAGSNYPISAASDKDDYVLPLIASLFGVLLVGVLVFIIIKRQCNSKQSHQRIGDVEAQQVDQEAAVLLEGLHDVDHDRNPWIAGNDNDNGNRQPEDARDDNDDNDDENGDAGGNDDDNMDDENEDAGGDDDDMDDENEDAGGNDDGNIDDENEDAGGDDDDMDDENEDAGDDNDFIDVQAEDARGGNGVNNNQNGDDEEINHKCLQMNLDAGHCDFNDLRGVPGIP